MRTAPYFHNMIGLLAETAHASPTPAAYTPATFPSRFANGQSTTRPGPDYPHPYTGGRWTLRQSCEYLISASMAVLATGASDHQHWQYGMYEMARDAMRTGADESYVISGTQWDPGAAQYLVNALRLGGVHVERATTDLTAGGQRYPTGSYVIPGAQPFLPFVRDLLTTARHTDSHAPTSPALPPYDIGGSTLSLQMGVQVDKVQGPVLGRRAAVTEPQRRNGRVIGKNETMFALDPRSNASFVAVNRLLRTGARVSRSTAAIETDAGLLPAGTFLVEPVPRSNGASLATALGLDVVTLAAPPRTPTTAVIPPRVGIYTPWGDNVDAAWTRWVLDEYEFPFRILRDADVRAGDLRESWDVILLPDAPYDSLLSGIPSGKLPEPYTGGLGQEGIRQLRTFTLRGGTLVAQSGAGALPVRAFELPVSNAIAGLGTGSFHAPGALLQVAIDTRHPIGWGMPPLVAIVSSNSPAFRVRPVPDSAPGPEVVARYVDDPHLSGWAIGTDRLPGTAAAIEVPLGEGRVVLLGMRAQHRGQAHATFKLLFNAILQN